MDFVSHKIAIGSRQVMTTTVPATVGPQQVLVLHGGEDRGGRVLLWPGKSIRGKAAHYVDRRRSSNRYRRVFREALALPPQEPVQVHLIDDVDGEPLVVIDAVTLLDRYVVVLPHAHSSILIPSETIEQVPVTVGAAFGQYLELHPRQDLIHLTNEFLALAGGTLRRASHLIARYLVDVVSTSNATDQ